MRTVRSSFASSPEFTTNGMLPKCWRRIHGKVYLYKGSTSGASNTGYEPYSEKYAYLVGKQLGFNVIPYKMTKWKGNLCSSCEIFTSKNASYIPVGRIIRTGGIKAVRQYYETLIKPAPLFDHGNALYNFAGNENWQSEALLNEYAKTLLPCVYDDFFQAAKNALNTSTSEKLRKALEFKFKDEGKLRYPKDRIDLLEKQIRNRASHILKGTKY